MYYPIVKPNLISSTRYIAPIKKVNPKMILQDLSIGIPKIYFMLL